MYGNFFFYGWYIAHRKIVLSKINGYYSCTTPSYICIQKIVVVIGGYISVGK